MPPTSHTAKFVGRWIGHTQGAQSSAHVWEITEYNATTLHITTRWEDGRHVSSNQARVLADEPGFVIEGGERTFVATLVDTQHFIIPEWDTNDIRNHLGPDYDVVFSRPGLAELTARRVWLKHRDKLAGRT
jgi:hypothetical protein